MATISYTLSDKVNSDGKRRVMVRFYEGSLNQRGKTNIYVDESCWDNQKGNLTVPRHSRRILTPEEEAAIGEANQVNAELENLRHLIMDSFYTAGGSRGTLPKKWLANLLDRYYNDTLQAIPGPNDEEVFFEEFDTFIKSRNFSDARITHYNVTRRELKRFSMVSGNPLSFNTIDEKFIDEYKSFLQEEHKYVGLDEEGKKVINNPLYKEAFQAAPDSRLPLPRSHNTIINKLNRFHAFYRWACKKKLCKADPFANYTIGTEVYGDPYALTAEERDKLYRADFSHDPQLSTQRDIFVLQTFIGCRVSEYYSLEKSSYWDEAIHYVANKTIKRTGQSVVVPIVNEIPREILKRYEDIPGDRLMPFISEQKYRDYIKEMIRLSGIDRKVMSLNKYTLQQETKMLSEAASPTHLARSTFYDCLLRAGVRESVADAMIAHTPNSRASKRYRVYDLSVFRDAASKL